MGETFRIDGRTPLSTPLLRGAIIRMQPAGVFLSGVRAEST
jgi:hypothetical protein